MHTTKDLLPGDLISLAFKHRSSAPPLSPAAAAGAEGGGSAVIAAGASPQPEDEHDRLEHVPVTARDEVVPCDCLLLRGAAVVSEASLTGESVPQMKEALGGSGGGGVGVEDEEGLLDMVATHRVHVLFSGTSLVTVDGSSSAEGLPGVPTPPDGGAVGFVLRTGFSSSQGTLMQMIEFSQQSVSGDSKETGVCVCVCACVFFFSSFFSFNFFLNILKLLFIPT